MKYLKLFTSFFMLGALTFGGGYAMLPLLEKEIVERRGWSTSAEMLDYYAIGQCTPGIIAVNVATMIGYQQGSLLGAAVATFGIVCPSLIIILILASLITNFSHLEVVQHAFAGISVAVAVLILSAIQKLLKSSVVDKLTLVLFVLSLVITVFLGISPIIIVVISAAVGILVSKHKGGAAK